MSKLSLPVTGQTYSVTIEGKTDGIYQDINEAGEVRLARIDEIITAAERTIVGHLTLTGAVDLDALNATVNKNKGSHLTEAALITAWPVGEAGWSAIVGATDTVWVWDIDTAAWVDTDKKGQVISVNGATGAVVLTQDDVSNGSTYVRTTNDYTTTEKSKLASTPTLFAPTNAQKNSDITQAEVEAKFPTGSAGDLLYHNGTNWTTLAKGTAGQVLTINAGATAPEWATP